MSSVHVHVPNMLTAVKDGTVPGEFGDGKKSFTFPTVTSLNSRGKKLMWSITVRLLKGGNPVPIDDKYLGHPTVQLNKDFSGEIVSSAKQEGGKERISAPTYITSGKNIGKTNATNVITQALRDALGLYNKQVKRSGTKGEKKAAKKDETEAQTQNGDEKEETLSAFVCMGYPGGSRINNRPRPMLVKKLGATADATLTAKDFAGKGLSGITAQRKYNGIRAVICLECAPESLPESTSSHTGGAELQNGSAADFGIEDIYDEAHGADEAPQKHEEIKGGAVDDSRAVAVMYSRTGGALLGHPHIKEEARQLLLRAPSVGDGSRYGIPKKFLQENPDAYSGPFGGPCVYLDGEIYLHGKPLNVISGQARKEEVKKTEAKLEFHVYDCFFPLAKAIADEKKLGAAGDMPSMYRQLYLDDLFCNSDGITKNSQSSKNSHLVRVENFYPASQEELDELARKFIKEEEFEGAIVRRNNRGYVYSVNNYHSSNLIKIKPIFDDEFAVVGYTQGTRGKDVGAIVWICEVDEKNAKIPSDRQFNVVPKDMSYEDRYRLFKCMGQSVEGEDGKQTTRFKRDFYGQLLTVEFPERSAKTGKPSQAKSLTFRTYENENGVDPIKQILQECLE